MTERLIPKKVEGEGDPLSQRWGLLAGYDFRLGIETPFTEPGTVHAFSVQLDIAEGFGDRYTLRLELPFGESTGKRLPSAPEGATTENSHRSVRAGFGRVRRFSPYFSGGDLVAAPSFATTPTIGKGKTTSTAPTRELDGESYSFGTEEQETWDVGTSYAFALEARPWGRAPAILIGPAFYYGVKYAEDGSIYNRVDLEFIPVRIQVGNLDATDDASDELGPMGIAQGFYALLHGLGQRYLVNRTLADQKERLANYNIKVGEGGDRGSLENLPALEAGAALMGGMGNPQAAALKSGRVGFWVFAAAQAAGGAIFLYKVDGTANNTAGAADLLGSARLLGFPIAGIETPDKRRMPADEVERREAYINLAGYALNTAVMLFGANQESGVAMMSGANANVQVALTPDPIEGDLVENTSVTYAPKTFLSSDKDGNRGGIIVHRSWHDIPSKDVQLFSSVAILSPALTPGNSIEHLSQDEPYEDAHLNSDVDAALGIEWKGTWHRLYGGIDTKAIFGGGDAAKVGIGGVAGFDVLVPFNGKEDGIGLVAGVRVMAHRIFPEGTQLEVVPHVGIGGSF